MNRRVFLSTMAGLTGIGQTLASPLTAVSLDCRLVTRKRFLMGTVFEVLAYTDSPDSAAVVIDQALAEIERLEAVFSSFLKDSEISRLNRGGCSAPCRLSSDLYRVIERSLEFSRLSGGRFDVTVGRLTRLSRQSQEEEEAPSASDFRDARASVDYRNLVLVPPDRLVTRADQIEIDLGAIAKGYAVDRASEVLRAGRLNRSLINAGRSSILALDPPPGESGWKVQLKANGQEVCLSSRAMSTSSQPPISGSRRGPLKGHVFDPQTGQPAEFGVSVTIICDSGTTADALSTTCLLLGYKQSCRILERFRNTSMIWTTPKGVTKTLTTNL